MSKQIPKEQVFQSAISSKPIAQNRVYPEFLRVEIAILVSNIRYYDFDIF